MRQTQPSKAKEAVYIRQLAAACYTDAQPRRESDNHGDAELEEIQKRSRNDLKPRLQVNWDCARLARLAELRQRVREDYSTGGFSRATETYVIDRVNKAQQNMRARVARNLAEIQMSQSLLSARELQWFYLREYLSLDQYMKLRSFHSSEVAVERRLSPTKKVASRRAKTSSTKNGKKKT